MTQPRERTSPAEHLPGLTGIRGAGAVWVFAYHATLGVPGGGVGIPVLAAGYMGVDLFFLLSGFVLSHATRSQSRWTGRDYLRFVRARMARIFPLNVATLGLVLLAVVLWPGFATSFVRSGDQFGRMGFVASALLVQNWALSFTTCWNTPAWSLSAEWFGYLVLPAVLLAVRRVRTATLAMTLCYACLMAFLAMLAVRGQWSVGVQGRPGMVRMFCEMAAGCLLYRGFVHGLLVGTAGSLAGLALLGIGALAPDADALVVLALPLIVLAAADRRTVICRMLSSRPAVFLGEISFSIYLTHWIILEAAQRILPSTTGLPVLAAARISLVAAIVLGVSMLTYRLVELPSRRFGRALNAARLPPAG